MARVYEIMMLVKKLYTKAPRGRQVTEGVRINTGHYYQTEVSGPVYRENMWERRSLPRHLPEVAGVQPVAPGLKQLHAMSTVDC